MLIHQAHEEESGKAGKADIQTLEDNSNEFETADEIYQIMAKTNVFEGDGDKALTTSDLVLLYKNIDIGTKLVPNTDPEPNRSPNQYVETVIYNDDRSSEGSDVIENISNEDLYHVCAINKERIDLLNNFGDKLCHKFGNIEMRTSDLTTDYEKHFLFNDPFIKEQLKSFRAISNSKQSDSTILPASLLDYICCKRLEDNYNFYMDNIIQYVQKTIEQLKRISNGDYLTEKAKAKWSEVVAGNDHITACKNIILAGSATIPLNAADKRNDMKITWDDIVHSEMDVRSIAKILEKKVIVEVPKIICGTYRLISKHCKENLIITCKKDPREDSRVDVVFKLQHSKSGDVVSNINSIQILKPSPALEAEKKNCLNDLLALELEKVNAIGHIVEQNNKIIELDENIEAPLNDATDFSIAEDRETEADKFSEDDNDFSPQCDLQICEDNECDFIRAEADLSTIATDDLHCIIKRLSMQSPVVEEREENMKKKKSPLRVRIKSPYENKTSVMEEKKRKKLLEIRQRRELKKNEMSVNCKIKKNQHEKSVVMAQASNSVTKLSITNKHFYNSIYGESINLNNTNSRKYHKDAPKVSVPFIKLEDEEANNYKSSSPTPLTTPEKNGQKYINHSFYLDDADTEVMHLENKLKENQEVAKDDFATSTEANDIVVNLNLIKKLMVASTTDLSLTDTSSSVPLQVLCENSFIDTEKDNIENNVLMSTQSTQAAVSIKTQKKEVFTEYEENYNPTMTSVKCRRSIDKIYELIKKISETGSLKGICRESRIAKNYDKLDSSDSGSSIKHQLLTSVNSSCLNFKKTNTGFKSSNDTKKKSEKQTSIITVSSKSRSNKFINNTNSKENKKLTFCKNQETPLKAISQLIREFDNVRKTNNKNGNELKMNKKNEASADSKSYSRPNSQKRIPKQDQNLKESEAIFLKNSMFKDKDRGCGPIKISILQHEEKSSNKPDIKKIADIIDEVKELRGEAVRGPPKKSTRLYSLAQPKKAYLSAQQEESQNRFGKRVPDRLSKPTIPIANPEARITSLRSKQRKVCVGLPATTKLIHTVGPALERSRNKALTNSSPSRDGNNKHSPVGRPCLNNNSINRTTELRSRKIEETKANVTSHYGWVPPSLELGNSYNAHKSRVPLIPNDLDLVSMTSSPSGPEESTVLGKRIHNIIDAMVNSNMPTLEALTECKENKPGDHLDDGSIAGSKSDEVLLSLSDYPVDIFEDKNIDTAVSQIPKDNNEDEGIDRNLNKTLHVTRLSYSTIELSKVDQISNGTFLKPLSSNNSMFNMTSKKSEQKFFILNRKIDSLTELKMLPVLSNNRIDFGFTKFPMQIATVGYVFPHIVKSDSMSKIRSIKNEDSALNSKQYEYVTDKALGKSIQCLRSFNKNKITEAIERRENAISQIPNANNNQDFLDYREVYATVVQKNGKNVQENAVEAGTIKDISEADIKSSNISNSTSLDILVGLLNEIKKMTTYGSHLSKEEPVSDFHHESKELEMILDKVSLKQSSVHHSVDNEMSLPSLDNLQILKARSSKLLHLPPTNKVSKDITIVEKKVTANTSMSYVPLSVDREVNAMILPTSYMHRFTDAPSLFNKLNVSTNVTDSLLKLINRPSRGSVYSFTECESVSNSVSKEMLQVPSKNLGKCIDSAVSPPVLEIQYLNPKEKFADIRTLAIYQNNYSNVEFDSLLKMKRDILVTVYSILVLTVFAALSFPEIMYRVY
ncbi:uncharacterized protein LOC120632797 isoform X1 [Pararge aegeria]|uniref:uncharacterized protein LOC120632797 isoform X1 n=1 Tax=Pararge aegeria TaxID=116150 RepID=UPI0019D0D559|nr:uncharacterized protein LOC120632797 isoform X1 [Pararge aegeria]